MNERGEILCVINTKHQEQLPKGKLDKKDSMDIKRTCFREYNEEAGRLVTPQQYEKCKEYISFSHYGRRHRFMIMRNVSGNGPLNHTRSDEILGQAWKHPNEFTGQEAGLLRRVIGMVKNGTIPYNYNNGTEMQITEEPLVRTCENSRTDGYRKYHRQQTNIKNRSQ